MRVAGKSLQLAAWECHVINEQPNTLRFTNETYAGEMCIMDGETVGATCSGF